jgi:hypothetical protein
VCFAAITRLANDERVPGQRQDVEKDEDKEEKVHVVGPMVRNSGHTARFVFQDLRFQKTWVGAAKWRSEHVDASKLQSSVRPTRRHPHFAETRHDNVGWTRDERARAPRQPTPHRTTASSSSLHLPQA